MAAKLSPFQDRDLYAGSNAWNQAKARQLKHGQGSALLMPPGEAPLGATARELLIIAKIAINLQLVLSLDLQPLALEATALPSEIQ